MRLWSITEQQFTVDETGFVFQFSSVHSEEIAAGRDAPDHDQEILLRLWNREMTKCLTIVFDRYGLKVRAELDSGDDMIQPPAPTAPGADANWDDEERESPLAGLPGFN